MAIQLAWEQYNVCLQMEHLLKDKKVMVVGYMDGNLIDATFLHYMFYFMIY